MDNPTSAGEKLNTHYCMVCNAPTHWRNYGNPAMDECANCHERKVPASPPPSAPQVSSQVPAAPRNEADSSVGDAGVTTEYLEKSHGPLPVEDHAASDRRPSGSAHCHTQAGLGSETAPTADGLAPQENNSISSRGTREQIQSAKLDTFNKWADARVAPPSARPAEHNVLGRTNDISSCFDYLIGLLREDGYTDANAVMQIIYDLKELAAPSSTEGEEKMIEFRQKHPEFEAALTTVDGFRERHEIKNGDSLSFVDWLHLVTELIGCIEIERGRCTSGMRTASETIAVKLWKAHGAKDGCSVDCIMLDQAHLRDELEELMTVAFKRCE